MATKTVRGVALIPLTITYGMERRDVTVPQSVPLVELNCLPFLGHRN